MIQAIMSDLGNVLLHFNHMRSCKAAARLTGLEPEEVYAQMFSSGLELRYDTGRISSEEFGNQVLERFGLRITLEELRSIWTDIFRPVKGMEALVRSLKGRYRLVLLSNTNPWHFEHCYETYPVVRLFDRYALSYEIGARKPERVIFEKALAMAGTPGEACLFIDDVQEYVAGAERLGLKGICFKDREQLEEEMRVLGIRISSK